MFIQNLPTYAHNFLEYKDWITVETPHYIINYTKDSEAEKDIELIKETQEKAYTKIVSTLNLTEVDKKITYYFYPNEELKTQLMGDDWFAQSILNEYCIHVLYTQQDKPIGPHEDTHLLTLNDLGQSTPFISEGLAEYMAGHAWDKKPHSEYVKDGSQKGLNMYPSKYLTKDDWFNTDDNYAIYFYSLVAEWTRFLIDNYGIDTYKEFYKSLNRNTTAEEMKSAYVKYFGEVVEEMEERFLKLYKNC